VGGGPAHGPRDLALLLEDARRHPHRQPRRRDVRELALLPDPDNYFVCLDAATGKERWHKEIANVKREYFSTAAPIVIRNHIIIGVGGDSLDVPGYLESRDPDTGELQWRWYTTPRPGEPGSETWPDKYSMEHGGGMPWLPGSYDRS
jgi:alcohol dehydrogenase (cytochrome c)